MRTRAHIKEASIKKTYKLLEQNAMSSQILNRERVKRI